MPIAVLGDTHGSLRPLYSKCLDGYSFVVITGDAGFLFYGNDKEKSIIRDLERLPFTILFIDGNHENFDLLNALPVESWHGGNVHRISQNLFHLMRGQIFDFEGEKLFCFGGGASSDKCIRKPGVDYWAQELPCSEEYDTGLRNLAIVNNSVDYIITHTAPLSTVVSVLGELKSQDELVLNNYLEEVHKTVIYRKWYFGHLNRDIECEGNLVCLANIPRDLHTGFPLS